MNSEFWCQPFSKIYGFRLHTQNHDLFIHVFLNDAKSKELLRYEAALGRKLAPYLCGLCLYDKHRLDAEQFYKLNNYHGHSITKGAAVKTI